MNGVVDGTHGKVNEMAVRQVIHWLAHLRSQSGNDHLQHVYAT